MLAIDEFLFGDDTSEGGAHQCASLGTGRGRQKRYHYGECNVVISIFMLNVVLRQVLTKATNTAACMAVLCECFITVIQAPGLESVTILAALQCTRTLDDATMGSC